MHPPQTIRLRPTPARWAAAIWLLSGLMWFSLEAIAASGFLPHYSFAHNFISDLGATVPGLYQGRPINSPLSSLMNFNFVAHGILFLTAAILAFRAAANGATRYPFVLVAALYALGGALVATFHESAQPGSTGSISFHFLGAILAILCGNIAPILAGFAAARLGASPPYRVTSLALGVLGFASAILLVALDPFNVPGVWERIAVDTVPVWEILTGGAFLISLRHRAPDPSVRLP